MCSTADREDILESSFGFGSSFVTPARRAQPLRIFLFGYPLHRSLAPRLHKSLFQAVSLPWTYDIYETQDASEFLPALRQEEVIGCAITMPYKVAMMSAVDEVTEEGRMIGAINTVFLRKSVDGATHYIGTNTDCIGIREAFLQNFPSVLSTSCSRPALVVGGGGACRAAIYALWKWLGASRIYLVNRLESEVTTIIDSFQSVGFQGELVHISTVQQAGGLKAPSLVVGTVPDFPPKEPGEVLAREIAIEFLRKPEKGIVLEMCYHPKPRTEFFELAEHHGWDVICGTEAMIWQGVAQQMLWAELPLDRFNVHKSQLAIS